ncbi:MAG: hypothetical protein F6K19_15095 [Cyanothece sp. SIO1E1]|nr:hypothetical protein [Cyanothece sp. SIO1E1]
MTTSSVDPNAPELSRDEYVVIGLATCFVKEDGEIRQVKVIEPIPSASLEAILQGGIPTSYECACATTLGTAIANDTPQKPTNFPAEAQFCSDFVARSLAAARTYKSRPEAQQHIALGTTRSDFNFSLERKRVLNAENIVSTEDNVKQHEYTHKVL